MSYCVRLANVDDIDDLVELRVKLLQEVGEIKTNKEVEQVRLANKNYLNSTILQGDFVAYLAEFDSHIVAISGIVFFKRPPHINSLSGIEAYIMNMYTLPKYRGKGIAGNLLDNCIQHCMKNKVGRVWLHASPEGRVLYSKKGFIGKATEMELFLTN
jgi:GNAT superfamily N-acetyltransferase